MSIRAGLAGIVCLILLSLGAPSVGAQEPTPEVGTAPRVSFQARPLDQFAPDVVAYLAEREGVSGVAIAVPSLGVVYTTDTTATFHLASVSKVMIMLTLLDQAATDKVKLLGYHWAYPGLGYAEKKDSAFVFVPAT